MFLAFEEENGQSALVEEEELIFDLRGHVVRVPFAYDAVPRRAELLVHLLLDCLRSNLDGSEPERRQTRTWEKENEGQVVYGQAT